MFKSRVYNGSKKLRFQKEVSESRTVYANIAPKPQKNKFYTNRLDYIQFLE